MTAELRQRIDDCWDLTTLEDIYLPYKPKRRTRAQVAREQGLEPLARIILQQREPDPNRAALSQLSTLNSQLSISDAIKGAQDIIAEQVSEDERSRNQIRAAFRREAFISSCVVKSKKDTDEAQKSYGLVGQYDPLVTHWFISST